MKTLTNSVFNSLTPLDQVAFFKEGGKLIADTAVTSLPTNSVADIFDTPLVVETVTNDFDIAGDAVYMNMSVTIMGQTFKLKSVKLTEKRQCMSSWDKDAKSWTDENPDVMSLIDMVRLHGSTRVNEHTKPNITFGKAGEKNTTRRDPFATA
tara:strand:+ start:4494 stop:4949 length:456 start_codon:yes stop_codon:yes gene_type:complete